MRVLFSSLTIDMLHHLFFLEHVEVWLASLYKEDTFVYVYEHIAHNFADNFHNLLPHASYNYGTCIWRFV